MTEPGTDSHPEPMEMFERYPEGHPKARNRVSRPARCACGEGYYQARLSPAWLDRMPGSRSKLLVDNATTIEQDGSVWLPAACPKCERASLNAPPPKTEAPSGTANSNERKR
jgi:hypothetical protein